MKLFGENKRKVLTDLPFDCYYDDSHHSIQKEVVWDFTFLGMSMGGFVGRTMNNTLRAKDDRSTHPPEPEATILGIIHQQNLILSLIKVIKFNDNFKD